MTKTEFKRMMIVLAENYGTDLTEKRLEALVKLAGEVFGYQHDWKSVTAKIAASEAFFPNIAIIGRYVEKKDCTPKQKAESLVDNFIAYLDGQKSFEEIGAETMRYCKARFNADKYAYQSGQINLDFKRREWIEKATQDFERPQTQLQQIESPVILELVSKTIRTT